MKKLIFALALLIMGGASLSTASAASISPAATISEAAQSDSTLQLTGGNREEAAKILDIGARTLYRKLEVQSRTQLMALMR